MKKNYIGFFVLLALFAGCNPATQSPQSVDVIMPLAVGNEWYWDVEYYAPDGTVTGNRKDSLLIISKRTVGGVERYVLWTGADIFYDGTALVTSINGFRKPFIWVRHPMPLNGIEVIDTIVITTEQSPDPIEDAQYILIHVADRIQVMTPTGSYFALKYMHQTRGMMSNIDHAKQYSYYAMNVGLVMKEDYILDSATNKLYLANRQRLTKVILK